MRTQDAVPDEVEVIPEGRSSTQGSRVDERQRSESTGGSPVPRTVVEKLDTDSPGHGQIPGTTAYKIHKADAVPDEIHKAERSETGSTSEPSSASSEEVPLPTTVITRVDSKPAHGEVPGTEAYDMRKGDAKPDILEQKGDVAGKNPCSSWMLSSEPMTESDLPTSSVNRSTRLAFGARRPYLEGTSPIAADGGFGPMFHSNDDEEAEEEQQQQEDEEEISKDANADLEAGDGFGDDFDDFEAGAGDDDFGDFDEGFQQPSGPSAAEKQTSPQPSAPSPVSPFVSSTYPRKHIPSNTTSLPNPS